MSKLESTTETKQNVSADKDKEFEWNRNEYNWYQENGLDYQQQTLEDSNLLHMERKFLAAYDKSKGEIKRHIRRMYRSKPIDLSDDRRYRREFLVIVEDWEASDALGQKLWVREHRHGIYPKLEVEQIINGYNRNGQPNVIGREPKVVGDAYYIPFTKEAVDEWIAKSYTTDKDSIEFWFKEPPNRVKVDYDDFFVDWKTAQTKFLNPPKEQPAIQQVVQAAETPLQLLQKKYVNGEITEKEYLKKKEILS